MFIVILILVQFNYKNTIAAAYNYGYEKIVETTYNDSTIANMNTATISSKALFEISKFRVNNKIKDLKGNIFDKMLSDEMLSIQQQIYEKNITSPVTIRISSKRYVPTPMLEVRQRWPIDRLQTNKEKKLDFEKHMKSIDDTEEVHETSEQEESICKTNCSSERVLELRSLSEKLHKIDFPSKSPRLSKKCTCVEHSNISTQKNKNLILGHKEHDEYGSSPHECTRTDTTISPATYPIYVTYSPYFIGTVADYSNFYYHPDAISDLKRPKNHKNGKHKKPASEEVNDSYADDKEYYDYVQAHEDHTKRTRKHKEKKKNNNEFKIIYYTTNEPDSTLVNYKDNIEVVNKDNFIDEIVEDLKIYYNEAVIKDCYCSSSSYNYVYNLLLYLLNFLMM